MRLVKTALTSKIIDYLNMNKTMNLNILGTLENRPELLIFTNDAQHPEGVLVKSGYMHFIYTENEAFLEAVLDQHMQDGFFGFAGVDHRIAKWVQEREQLHWRNPCTIYVYPEDQVMQKKEGLDVRPLELKHAELVDAHYEFREEGRTLAEIQADISERPSSAVFVADEPVCWVLTHADNSMGIMYTVEDYRRRGFAEVVTRDLTQRHLDRGLVPFLQIIDRNGMSPGLALKSGFVPAGQCEWFGIIRGRPQMCVDMAYREQELFAAAFGRTLEVPEKLELMYTMMDWHQAGAGMTATAARLEKDASRTGEALAMLGLDDACDQFDLWTVEESGRLIGAALLREMGDEDASMHIFKAREGYEAEVVNALALGLRKRSIFYLQYCVDRSDASVYRALGFESFGPLKLEDEKTPE